MNSYTSERTQAVGHSLNHVGSDLVVTGPAPTEPPEWLAARAFPYHEQLLPLVYPSALPADLPEADKPAAEAWLAGQVARLETQKRMTLVRSITAADTALGLADIKVSPPAILLPVNRDMRGDPSKPFDTYRYVLPEPAISSESATAGMEVRCARLFPHTHYLPR